MLQLPREAESGSAGVQPDKEYLGRRCADAASGPGGRLTLGPHSTAIGRRSHASKNPSQRQPMRHRATRAPSTLEVPRLSTREISCICCHRKPILAAGSIGNGSTPSPTFYPCRVSSDRVVARNTPCLIRPKASAPAWCGAAHLKDDSRKNQAEKRHAPTRTWLHDGFSRPCDLLTLCWAVDASRTADALPAPPSRQRAVAGSKGL
jgi:hypothetical protein